MNVLVFWSLLALMTLAAAGFIVLPLLRRGKTGAVSRRAVNIEIYQQRLRELDDALTRGEASEAETAAARTDAERALINDVTTAEDNSPAITTVTSSPGSRSGSLPWPLLAAVLLIFPAMALGFYLWNADWRLAMAADGPAAMAILLTRLETHLEQQPTDSDGWKLLAQSRARLGQHERAASAYARLNALSVTADGLAGEAEALGQVAGGSLLGRPAQLLAQSLRLDADHPRALWYAGLAALQQGDNTVALQHWSQLAQQELPGEFRGVLDAQILAAGGKPSQRTLRPTTEIALEISLAAEFSAEVSDDMPVFIYARDARAAGQKGPPLAVLRRRVADLPLSIHLSDEHSMLPDRKLSSVNAWTITARVARQGSAESRSGDLFVETQVQRAELAKTLRLTIDKKLP